jgi:hypothetical protein
MYFASQLVQEWTKNGLLIRKFAINESSAENICWKLEQSNHYTAIQIEIWRMFFDKWQFGKSCSSVASRASFPGCHISFV